MSEPEKPDDVPEDVPYGTWAAIGSEDRTYNQMMLRGVGWLGRGYAPAVLLGLMVIGFIAALVYYSTSPYQSCVHAKVAAAARAGVPDLAPVVASAQQVCRHN
jgi:hypothetical protein